MKEVKTKKGRNYFRYKSAIIFVNSRKKKRGTVDKAYILDFGQKFISGKKINMIDIALGYQ